MKAVLALVKAWLSWAWSWVKWADAKAMAVVTPAGTWVVAHLAVYKKHYFWLATGASLAGYFFWASVVGVFHWVADPMVQAMAPVPHVSSTPDTLLDSVAVFPTAMPTKLADAPKPKPSADLAPLKPVVVAPLQVAPKAPSAPVKLYRAKKAKPAVSSPYAN